MKYLIFALLLVTSLYAKEKIIRVGHFPNITHAQALIGHELSQQGKGWFEERFGPNVEIQWFVYNAGPSAMEAILADSIDIAYVGPGPAINAFVKSKGQEVRIISGSCSGGAALVVRRDSHIKTDADFKGKKIATPQFGNTQDIACRAWLQSIGYKTTPTGGDVLVVPTENPDQLMLFQQGDLEAAWTIEPWVSRLLREASGEIYFNESKLWPETNGKYVTTHVVVSAKFLEDHPWLAKKWVLAQVELTDWINQNPDQAKKLILQAFKSETKFDLNPEILNTAWPNLEFTYDPVPVSLQRYADDAFKIGFLKEKPDLKGIYQLQYLDEILKEKKQ